MPEESEGRVELQHNLYWVGTPRHFLIAAALATAEAQCATAHLLVTTSYEYDQDFQRLLAEWQATPFSRVEFLHTRTQRYRLMALLQDVRISRSVRSLTRRHRFAEIRSFTLALHAQSLLHDTLKRHPNTKRVVLEDGGIWYNGQAMPIGTGDGRGFRRLLRDMTYGRAISASSASTIDAYVDQIFATRPELLRDELRSPKASALDAQPVLALRDTELPRLYCRASGCELAEIEGIQMLVVLSRSDGLDEPLAAYKSTVDDMLRVAAGRGLSKIAIKYHPKEPQDDYMALRGNAEIVEVPRRLPAELVLICSAPTLEYTLGDLSSTLISAPWLVPGCRTLSFADLVQKKAELRFDDLAAFDIESLASVDELDDILSVDHPGKR